MFGDAFSSAIRNIDSNAENYIPQLVDAILQQAKAHKASDIHLVPREDGLLMQWRVDGVLHSVAGLDGDHKSRVIARLKVLAGLLTYRTDVPQEGRLQATEANASEFGEVRISTFPTLYGEKVAVRLFAEAARFERPHDLGLPPDVLEGLSTQLAATSGVILLTGPSGSGKTTTAYACLRKLVQRENATLSVATLEDPIESVVNGAIQSQVQPHVGFDLATGLRSLMRQDPDVIFVGEIRDPETAECAFQAALTGHLVLTTFHAGNNADAVTRLLDLNIEPYLVRSALRAVICQRLLRRMCSGCGNDIKNCRQCLGTGYAGRVVAAELMTLESPELVAAIMKRADAKTLQRIATKHGILSLRDRADSLVAAKQTTADEVYRVLGGDC